ncbi:MAG: hypothetical protein ACPL7B_07760 [Candidatus Poribacteria bacterium]
MKNLIKLFYFAIIPFFIAVLTGCSVGIRPAYYDLPPLDSSQYYYGEPVNNQYYNVSSPLPSYSSGYDPWTMGTYYDYNPPQRTGYSSGVSASSGTSTWDSSNRPSMRDRGTSSSYESKAPVNDQSYLRRERTVQDSSTSDVASRKMRRNVIQNSSSDQDQSLSSQSDQSNVKRRPQTSDAQNSSSTGENKDDEKEKQKRSTTN